MMTDGKRKRSDSKASSTGAVEDARMSTEVHAEEEEGTRGRKAKRVQLQTSIYQSSFLGNGETVKDRWHNDSSRPPLSTAVA